MRRLTLCLTLIFTCAAVAGDAEFTPATSPVSPSGTAAAIDLPARLHLRNTGGSDGLGLCVFTSVEVAARWQNVREFDGFQDWMKRRPGGGYPSKLDRMITEFARDKGFAPPLYVQHTGGDESILELALRTGRMPSVTYAGRDDFYRGRIAHMVDLAHLDATEAAILDNNRPGVWVWMTRQEFLSRWRDMQGGWAVVLLGPPPPPPATSPSFGQCVGPNCPPMFWEGPHGHAEKRFWILTQGGAALGMLSADGWRPAIGHNTFAGDPSGAPPAAPPKGYTPAAPPPEQVETIENFGVDQDKIHQGPRYTIGGHEVDRDTALRSIQFRDDSERYHLTIVSDDDAARRQAIQSIATSPELSPYRDRVHVQGYRSSDWPVASRGLRDGLTVQKPRSAGGGVVWHSGEFNVAMLAEALRHADPNYTPPRPMPEPVPGPGPGPAPAPLPGPREPLTIPTNLVLLLIAAAAVWIHLRNSTR